MERYYDIAGIDICIKGKDEEMYTDGHRLKPFSRERKEAGYNYLFSIVDKLDDYTGKCIYQNASRRVYQDGDKKIQYIGSVQADLSGAYIRCETLGEQTQVQVLRKELPNRITSKVVLTAMGIEALALKTDAFILHSSFINVNGQAILFTAPSGTGKSTQAELWRQFRGADIVNGDRAIVKINGEGIEACGLPFAGSSEYCKDARLPLAAVVCLEQAEKTVIEPMRGIKAFRRIWEQITIPLWEEQATEQISEMLSTLLGRIPVYRLSCTPDESAVIALENVLKGSRKSGKEK